MVNQLHLEDRGFFNRFTFGESEYGTKIQEQYENVQQLWPLQREKFEATKNEVMMSGYHAEVEKEFNIKWVSMQYDELVVPLYSGIALYFHLRLINAFPIPWDSQGQSDLYGSVTGQPSGNFIDYIESLAKINQQLCKHEAIDLVFLADESRSVQPADFILMKNFMADIIDHFNIGESNTRVAIRTFSTRSTSHITLNQYEEDLVEATHDIYQTAGGTNTALALSDVMEYDFVKNSGMRGESKKVICLTGKLSLV